MTRTKWERQGSIIFDNADTLAESTMSIRCPDRETAELIVRLVNLEPEIIAVLEKARERFAALQWYVPHLGYVVTDTAGEGVRAIDAFFAVLRGDAPSKTKVPNWIERPSKEPGGKPERYVNKTDPAVKDALAELEQSYQALTYPGTGVTLAAVKALWVDVAHLLEILARKPTTYVSTCRFCGTSRELKEGDAVPRCPCSETTIRFSGVNRITSPSEVRYAARFGETAAPVRLNSDDPALDPAAPPVITQLRCSCGAVWVSEKKDVWKIQSAAGGGMVCGICTGLLQFRDNIGAETKVSLNPSLEEVEKAIASRRDFVRRPDPAVCADQTPRSSLPLVPQYFFPIQNGPAIPWEMIAPHEAQAKKNHDQTLERLAQRGGLSPYEAVYVLESRKLTGSGLHLGDAHWLDRLTSLIDAWHEKHRTIDPDVLAALKAAEEFYDYLESEEWVEPSETGFWTWAWNLRDAVKLALSKVTVKT